MSPFATPASRIVVPPASIVPSKAKEMSLSLSPVCSCSKRFSSCADADGDVVSKIVSPYSSRSDAGRAMRTVNGARLRWSPERTPASPSVCALEVAS